MHDIFYFTDIHGMYDLYRAIINYCNEQDPEAMIIFGGDACDRGPDGYKIIKELLDNPNICYLMGNHEEMFIQAAYEVLEHFDIQTNDVETIRKGLYNTFTLDDQFVAIPTLLYNGGLTTLTDWILDGQPVHIIERLKKLACTFSYDNYDFCHAGDIYNTFKVVADAEYEGEEPDSSAKTAILWNRTTLNSGWAPDRTCIFGHTPTPYLAAKYYGRDKSLANAHPCAYIATLDDKWTGRKIDMDTGAFASGKLYVLNCLTMKAQGFRDTDVGNDEIRKHDIEKIEVIQF